MLDQFSPQPDSASMGWRSNLAPISPVLMLVLVLVLELPVDEKTTMSMSMSKSKSKSTSKSKKDAGHGKMSFGWRPEAALLNVAPSRDDGEQVDLDG